MTVIRLEFSESVTLSDDSVWTGLGCSTGCWTGIWGWAIIGCCITWGWSESLLFPLIFGQLLIRGTGYFQSGFLINRNFNESDFRRSYIWSFAGQIYTNRKHETKTRHN